MPLAAALLLDSRLSNASRSDGHKGVRSRKEEYSEKLYIPRSTTSDAGCEPIGSPPPAEKVVGTEGRAPAEL